MNVAKTVNRDATRPATSNGTRAYSYLADNHAIASDKMASTVIPILELSLYFEMPIAISRTLL
jgi:hypothetical protein